MISDSDRHWSDWDRRDWNAALLRHFFVGDGEIVRPVVRLLVTPDELCNVVGEPSKNAVHVRDSFLTAIQCTARKFRHFLSTDVLKEWDEKEELPPFFVYLSFTCFVASGFDEDIVVEGNFRERICKLLNHHTQSNLPDLAQLWRRFRDWLDMKIAEGKPYRPLKLPAPGHMVRIGYSVRLAFPRRKDLIRLSQELEDHDSPESLFVGDVLRKILNKQERFSKSFKRELKDFRSKYVSGKSSSRLYDHPFWASVRAATALPNRDEVKQGQVVYQLMLNLQSNPHQVSLLASTFPHHSEEGLSSKFVETHVPGYDYFIVSDDEDELESPVAWLLGQGVPEGVPDIHHSPVWKSVRQGILLFCPNEAGFWELIPTLPSPEDEVRALIRQDLCRSFRQHYKSIRGESFYDSPYPGWREVDAFRGKHLWRSTRPPSSLRDIRCLQKILKPPRVRLEGAIALHDGYLGIPPLIPKIKSLEADEVTIHQAELSDSGSIDLVQQGDAFVISLDAGKCLEGKYNVVALSEGEVLAQRRIVFRSRGLEAEYKRPTSRRTWVVEGSKVDCHRMSGHALRTKTPKAGESGAARVNFPTVITPRDDEGGGGITEASFSGKESDVSRFVECCAALASNRKGIPTPEFLRLINDVFQVRENHRLKWEIARSWVESGCFDRAFRTRWRGASYFARSPHLVVRNCSDGYRATLAGLIVPDLRLRLVQSAQRLDLLAVERHAFSPWSPRMLSWTATSKEQLELLCDECELPRPEEIAPLASRVASVESVALRARSATAHYEFHKSWRWEDGAFSSDSPVSESGVQIERRCRHDRADVYRVLQDGKEICCTHSRNWSLLFAYALRGQIPFEKRGRRGLIRNVSAQVYLPVPIARYIAVAGIAVPGPFNEEDKWTYGYGCSTNQLRDRLISSLWNTFDNDTLRKRLKWIAALADRYSGTHSVRYRLSESLAIHVHDAYLLRMLHRLTASPIPSRVLPQLRKLEREIISRNAPKK